MRHPDPFPPSPHDVSPARVAADLIRALTGQGVTGIYTAAAAKFAVISVTAELTVWTNGHQVWCTHHGQRLTWPGAGSPGSARQRRPDVAAVALDALEHLIGAHPLPRVKHLAEQRIPVGEMPVEAALGHAERLRQGLDPDGARAAGRKGPQAFLDPPATGRSGDGGHSLSLSVRAFTVTLAVLHLYGTV
jgi:hypothetical protein